MLQTNETCRTCGNKLIQRETQKKAAQLKKQYYYTAYYFCTKCQKIYHNDKFKVINNNQISLLGEQVGSRQAQTIIDYDVEIWTDGACVSNGQKHARAAWSFVSHSASSGQANKTEKAGLVPGAKQTNNVAEGLAIFHALDWAAKNNFKKIKIYTDSQITIHNLKKPAQNVKVNQEIFRNIENIINQNNLEVVYEKVLGHSGDVNNTRADKLANSLAGIK
jgi:ribonuclease HI